MDKLSFHIEASNNLVQTLVRIKDMDMKCGIAINAAKSERDVDYLYKYILYISNDYRDRIYWTGNLYQ